MHLQVSNLHKHFGGVAAIDGCSFTCGPTSLTGLVGPNGSGKSTLFNVIGGIVRPDAGEVTLGDQRLTGLAPHLTARAGIARTFQTTRLFKSLTVLDNILLGASSRAAGESSVERARVLLDGFGLADLEARQADALSFGQQRLVELARAMIGKPRFILLDEPFAGLSPLMALEFERHVTGLADAGIGAILIEHNLSVVLRLCPRIIVLNRGKLIADGPPDEVCRNPSVIDAYLGDAHAVTA